MSLRTPKLDLPYIAPAQAQKHVTHNEAIRALDALVQLSVMAIADSPDENPADGARYIVSDSPLGEFDGEARNIAAFQDGAWRFFNPKIGWQAYEQSGGALLVFTDEGWLPQISEALPPEFTPKLGVNGGADDVNRLLVRSEASLMDNVGAGHQFKVNKAGEGDTASLLFQSAYRGHAEMGLTGSNDFALRVSVDGGQFTDSLRADASNGDISFPNGINRDMLLPTISTAGDRSEFYGFPNLVTVSTTQLLFNLTANRVYFNAVFVDRPTDITGALVALTRGSTDASAIMRLGVFDIGNPDGDDWQIGARRADFGTKLASDAGGLDYSLDGPVTLERGWYMFALAVNGAGAQVRYLQSYTPGLQQFELSGSGGSTLYRISGPSSYSYISNQGAVIRDGFPADWGDLKAIDNQGNLFRTVMFSVPKFKHWNPSV